MSKSNFSTQIRLSCELLNDVLAIIEPLMYILHPRNPDSREEVSDRELEVFESLRDGDMVDEGGELGVVQCAEDDPLPRPAIGPLSSSSPSSLARSIAAESAVVAELALGVTSLPAECEGLILALRSAILAIFASLILARSL